MNQSEPTKILIVGAGISGLVLAKRLSPKFQSTLLEKSRGVGGRIATRRKESGAWDHGIPFLSKHDVPESLWNTWKPFLKEIPNSDSSCFAAPHGLTELAKNLAADLKIIKECRVNQISFQKKGSPWKLTDENQKEYFGDLVVLAIPVPQAIELLRSSLFFNELKLAPLLEPISYSSQLVLLGISDPFPEANPEVFSVHNPFERVINNGRKGILKSDAFFTAYLTPAFSQEHFNDPPEILLPFLQETLSKDYGILASHLELKKWRYSQCLNPSSQSFAQGSPPYESLFCIGDGFSEGGFRGALESALALAARLS